MVCLYEINEVVLDIARENLNIDAVGEASVGEQLLGALDVLCTIAIPAIRIAAPHRRIACNDAAVLTKYYVGELLTIDRNAQRFTYSHIIKGFVIYPEVDAIPVARHNVLGGEFARVAEQRLVLRSDGQQHVDLAAKQRLGCSLSVSYRRNLDASQLWLSEEVVGVRCKHRGALRVEGLHRERTSTDRRLADGVERVNRSHQRSVVGEQHR